MVDIQSINDSECFIWCLVNYLHPTDHNPARTRKVEKDFIRKLDLKDIKLPVKIKVILERKNCIGINVLGYEFMCQKILLKGMLIYY